MKSHNRTIQSLARPIAKATRTNSLRLAWVCAAVITATCPLLLAEVPEEGTPQRTNLYTVPKVASPIEIDGKFGAKEWAGAAILPPLVAFDTGLVSERGTRVYLGFDETHFYVGWELKQQPNAASAGEGAVAASGKDTLWRRDSVQIFIQPDPGKPGAVAFAGNADGEIEDGFANPTVDKTQSWEWEYATGKTGGGWHGELRISFEELGMESAPADGTIIRFDFVRNDAQPPKELSMLAFREKWHDHSLYCTLRFDREAPAIRFLEAGAIGENSAGTTGEVLNFSGVPAEVRLTQGLFRGKERALDVAFFSSVDSGVQSDGDDLAGITMTDERAQIVDVLEGLYEQVDSQEVVLSAEPDRRAAFSLLLNNAGRGSYVAALKATKADGTQMVSSLLPFALSDPLTVDVIPYFLDAEVLVVKAKLQTQDLRERTREVRFVLSGEEGDIASKVVDVESALDEVELPVHGLTPGSYKLNVVGLDAEGVELAVSQTPIVRPPDPWWATVNYGKKAFVPPPWTPVEQSGPTVSVWGREYTMDRGWLPSQVRSDGVNLFSGAPSAVLSVDGKTHELLEGKPELIEESEEARTFRWEGDAGGVPVRATTTIEFDGMVIVELEIDASGRKLDQFRVDIPLDGEQAKLYALNAYNFTPSKDGPKDAGSITEGFEIGMNRAVWVGNTQRGFQWCAATSEHWQNPRRNNMISVKPDGKSVVLRLNVVEEAFEPGRPMRFKWGFVATPTRPLPDSRTIYYQAAIPDQVLNSTDEREKLDVMLARAKALGSTFYNAFHWPQPHWGQLMMTDKEAIEATREGIRVAADQGMGTTVYAGWNAMTIKSPEWNDFGQAMIVRPGRFSWGGWDECPQSTYKDYLANGVAWLVKEVGAKGVYLDSTLGGFLCSDPRHGCGYVDEASGERIPTWGLWGQREMIKRIYKILHGELIPDGFLISHSGQPPLMALESFADFKQAGEGAYYSKNLKDWFDLDRYLAYYNTTQYGIPLDHTWQPDRPIAQNAVWGVALLHGNQVKFYDHNVRTPGKRANDYASRTGIDWRMAIPHHWFEGEGATWYPYYSNSGVLESKTPDVYASFRLSKDRQKMVFFGMNMEEIPKEADFRFNIEKLGLPAELHALDVVTGERIPIDDGALRLKFDAERPRVLLIGVVPPTHDEPDF